MNTIREKMKEKGKIESRFRQRERYETIRKRETFDERRQKVDIKRRI